MAVNTNTMPIRNIDWTLYNKINDITFELAGIIRTLGFTLEGQQRP